MDVDEVCEEESEVWRAGYEEAWSGRMLDMLELLHRAVVNGGARVGPTVRAPGFNVLRLTVPREQTTSRAS